MQLYDVIKSLLPMNVTVEEAKKKDIFLSDEKTKVLPKKVRMKQGLDILRRVAIIDWKNLDNGELISCAVDILPSLLSIESEELEDIAFEDIGVLLIQFFERNVYFLEKLEQTEFGKSLLRSSEKIGKIVSETLESGESELIEVEEIPAKKNTGNKDQD